MATEIQWEKLYDFVLSCGSIHDMKGFCNKNGCSHILLRAPILLCQYFAIAIHTAVCFPPDAEIRGKLSSQNYEIKHKSSSLN